MPLLTRRWQWLCLPRGVKRLSGIIVCLWRSVHEFNFYAENNKWIYRCCGFFACRFFWRNMEFYWKRDVSQHPNFCEKQQASVLLVLPGFFRGFFPLSQIHVSISPIRRGRLMMLVSRSEWEHLNLGCFCGPIQLLKWDWEQQRAGAESHIRNSSNGTAFVSWQKRNFKRQAPAAALKKTEHIWPGNCLGTLLWWDRRGRGWRGREKEAGNYTCFNSAL